MANPNMTLSGGPRIVGNLKKLGDAGPRLAGQALYLEGKQIEGEAKRLTPVDRNALRGSGNTRRGGSKDSPEVVVFFGGAAAPYAVVVHEGRLPGSRRPPSEALEPWVTRKLGLTGAEMRSAAYFIARKIGEMGTVGVKFLEIPFRQAVVQMDMRIASFIRLGLAKQAK